MKKGNYDGISCVMTPQEARAILRIYEKVDTEYPNRFRFVMVGVATSTKTMLGLPVKRATRFVKLANLSEIFGNHPLALNIIHHATDDVETLALQLMQVAVHAGPNLHGFQLNTTLPSGYQLTAIRKAFPDARLIMNLAETMRLEAKAQPDRNSSYLADYITDKIASYGELFTDVLIDASGGRGVAISHDTALTYVKAMRRRFNGWIGLAGNLGPGRLQPIAEVVAEDKKISVDAETQLRNLDDDLDLGHVHNYLNELGRMFSVVQDVSQPGRADDGEDAEELGIRVGDENGRR